MTKAASSTATEMDKRTKIDWTSRAMLTAFALALFWRASSLTLSMDEQVTAWAAGQPWAGLLGYLQGGPAGGNSLYYLFMWVWTALVGTSELALRLPSIAAMLTFFVMIRRRIAATDRPGSRDAARLTMALFVTSPFLFYYGMEARAYAFGVLATAVSVLAIIDSMGSKEITSTHTKAVVAGTLAILMHPAAVLVIAPFAVVHIAMTVRTNRRPIALWSMAAIGVLVLAWLVHNPQFRNAYINVAAGPTEPFGADLTRSLAMAFGVPEPLALTLAVIAILGWLSSQLPIGLRLVATFSIVATFPAVMMLANAFVHNYGTRYGFAAITLLYLGLAWISVRLLSEKGKLPRRGFAIMLAALWCTATVPSLATQMTTKVRGTRAHDDKSSLASLASLDAPNTRLIVDAAHTTPSGHAMYFQQYLKGYAHIAFGSMYDYSRWRQSMPPEIVFSDPEVLDVTDTIRHIGSETRLIWHVPVPSLRAFRQQEIQRFWKQDEWGTSEEFLATKQHLTRNGFSILAEATNVVMVEAPLPITREVDFWRTSGTIADAVWQGYGKALDVAWVPLHHAYALEKRIAQIDIDQPQHNALQTLLQERQKAQPLLTSPATRKLFEKLILAKD